MTADETIDLQAVTIGVGTLVAIGFLAHGTVVSGSVLGVATTTAAAWAFAATFAVLAALHAATGRSDLALAHGGAAVGWGQILVGSSGLTVLTGLLLLGFGGGYVARTTIGARAEQRTRETERERNGPNEGAKDLTEETASSE